MKKRFVKPEIRLYHLETQNVLASSGKGCSCGCYSRDYPQTNAGCNGCPHCGHDNSFTHTCDDEGYWD